MASTSSPRPSKTPTLKSVGKKPSPNSIVVMGNPLLDISANTPASILDKYALKAGDAIMAGDSHRPLYAELESEYKPEYIAGGAAQNSARVAQWISRVPGVVSYIGSVGDDKHAETLESVAKKDGMNVHYLKHADKKTGVCAVLVVDKERSLVADLQAAEAYQHDHLASEAVSAVWKGAKIFYMAGFFLTHSFESALHIAKHAAETNKIFTLNLAAPFILEVPVFRERVTELLPYVDILFGNEVEAATLGKVMEWGDDLKAVGAKMQAYKKTNSGRPRTVVFTQGKDSTLVFSPEGVNVHPVDKVPAEELVDSNGAGDSFVGGFLAALAHDLDHDDAVNVGHYSAAMIIRRPGCTFPDHHDIDLVAPKPESK